MSVYKYMVYLLNNAKWFIYRIIKHIFYTTRPEQADIAVTKIFNFLAIRFGDKIDLKIVIYI